MSIYPGESAAYIKEQIIVDINLEISLNDYDACPDGDIPYKIVVREVSEEEDPWQGRHLEIYWLY